MDRSFFSQAGYLQFEISLGDAAANLERVKSLLHGLAPAEGAIIGLPELWAYGFDYGNAAAHADGTPDLVRELRFLAAERDIILAGSLLENAGEKGIYNTLYFVGPEGEIGVYRKQHLFAFWGEEKHFSPGDLFYPVASPHGSVGGLVCYDLRFPELARSQAFHGAQLLVVAAEWPLVRLDHWRTLLRARAIENQVYVIGCNSCGTTGGHALGGHSMVVGPDGTVLLEAGEGEEARIADLNVQALSEVRQRFCPPGERTATGPDGDKRVELPELLEKLSAIRRQGSRIVFTNGCFDILHSGHVAYLEKARRTGDCLVVGLNSDRSVRAIKGEERPINQELDRARILSALASVDYVVIFDEETPYNLITAILPDVLVKGADWAEDDIVGAREVKAAGGRVVRVGFEHDVSTSGMINKIQSRKLE